jgi:hypothetical protein
LAGFNAQTAGNPLSGMSGAGPQKPATTSPARKKGGSSADAEETAHFPTTRSEAIKPW